MNQKPLFSVVIPVYQNEDNLPDTIPECLSFFKKIANQYNYELILVNDGSLDRSWELLKMYQLQFPEVLKVIKFTKNFGQRMATLAGVTYARGQIIGVISADLQDPIELFENMLKDWASGKKLVIANRKERSDGIFSDLFSTLYYWAISKYAIKNFPKGGFDFWLMDKVVAKQFVSMAERNGNTMMGIFSLGYDFTLHPYVRKKRLKGKSQYSFWKKIESFYDSLLAYSYAPVRLVTLSGFLASLIGFSYALYLTFLWFINRNQTNPVPGWSSIVVLIIFFSGLILISLGVIGEYIWRIYDELRPKPNFVIDEAMGIEVDKQ